MLSDANTIGIDFYGLNHGAVVLDLAFFLNHLALMQYEPRQLLATLIMRRKRLAEAFLHGYRRSNLQFSSVSLAWARLHGLVRMYIQAKKRESERVRAVLLSRFIRIEMQRMIVELQALP
jgi:hypothetical protein